jgi:hypothetical protein
MVNTPMGFEEVSSSSGYTNFGKGANLIIKPQKIEHDRGEYQGEEYFQLHFVFDATPENGGDLGRAPAWLSSKITLKESDEHTSGLGKFLRAAGTDVLEAVLVDLGADEALVREVKAGEERWVAESKEENIELVEALAKNIEGVVLRAGSKLNSSDEYSVVKEFYERVETDPFPDEDEADDAGDGAEESADEVDDGVAESETGADVESQEALA